MKNLNTIKKNIENQFQRVLDQMLKGSVSSNHIEELAKKYDTKNNSTVNYRLFLNSVNQSNRFCSYYFNFMNYKLKTEFFL